MPSRDRVEYFHFKVAESFERPKVTKVLPQMGRKS